MLGRRHLGDAGVAAPRPLEAGERRTAARWAVAVAVGVVLVAGLGVFTGVLTLNRAVNVLTVVVLLVTVAYFARTRLDKRLTDDERTRMRAYLWLFVFAAAFWLIYDQAGSVLNLFAEKHTDRNLAGFTFPASWLQSVNPVLIMVGAPPFAVLWLKTGNRISTPVKFTAGLVLNGLSFVIMAGAAQLAVGGAKVSPWWLVAVGDAVGGQVARLTATMALPVYFLVFGLASVALGLAAVVATRHIKRLMVGVH